MAIVCAEYILVQHKMGAAEEAVGKVRCLRVLVEQSCRKALQ